jgi:hypothetical protein
MTPYNYTTEPHSATLKTCSGKKKKKKKQQRKNCALKGTVSRKNGKMHASTRCVACAVLYTRYVSYIVWFPAGGGIVESSPLHFVPAPGIE